MTDDDTRVRRRAIALLGVRAIAAEGLRSRMLLQVHDELVLEVADGERAAVEELVRREMGAAYALNVPLDVSVGYGRSWDDAAHWRFRWFGGHFAALCALRSCPDGCEVHTNVARKR